ncbi:MAG: hypothetical protein HY961_21140 [Ignavibacteriae bacterium]|nr:hypothetical protein [Ignavibacteriota bacterium]
MQIESVDTLLQVAWLEGWVQTHGAYEKKVARLLCSEPSPSRDRMVERLIDAIDNRKSPAPLTIGSMLRSMTDDRRIRVAKVFVHAGMSPNLFLLIEQDAISPLKISVEIWRKMMQMSNVPIDDFAGMIRRTQQLVHYRPAFKDVLARCRSGQMNAKRQEMEEAYVELYAKAILPIPKSDEMKLKQLLDDLKNE